MADCEKNYRNLGDAYYGARRMVTSEILKNSCENDAYLLMLCEELEDMTDPEMRKWMLLVDTDISFGMKHNSGQNRWEFEDGNSFSRIDQLDSLDYIDVVNTTARVDLAGGKVTLQPKNATSGWSVYDSPTYRIAYTKVVLSVVEKDKGVKYSELDDSADVKATASTWCQDGGYLYVHCSDGADPDTHQMIVEWENVRSAGPNNTFNCNAYWYVGYKRDVRYWASPDQLDDSLGADIASVARAQTWVATASGLVSTISIKLHGSTHAEDRFYLELRTTSGGAPTSTVLGRIEFDIRKFQKGSFVSFPFPHPVAVTSGTKYAWVARSPFTSYQKHYGIGGWNRYCHKDYYKGGDSFVSYDNGQTWKKYGKNESLPYSEGKYAPQDFAFQIHCIDDDVTYQPDDYEYLYLKPFSTSPIRRVQLSVGYTLNYGTIVWEVSPDFENWYKVNEGTGWIYEFADPKPNIVWVRAKLKGNRSHVTSTPEISQVTITTYNDFALNAYVRTRFYTPRLTNPLGASVWSRIHAPTYATPDTTVAIDIVRNTIKEEIHEMGAGVSTITLDEDAAYPIVSLVHVSTGGVYTELTEERDYSVNYTTKVLTFDSAPGKGDVKIEYNPLWMKDLTPDDFSTEAPLGMRVDLFTETFTVPPGGQAIWSLKCPPLDPVREVKVDGVDQVEYVDYNVDYLVGEIDFGADLTADQVVEIKYTPCIEDTGLGIAYRLSRADETKNVHILPYFFKTRT